MLSRFCQSIGLAMLVLSASCTDYAASHQPCEKDSDCGADSACVNLECWPARSCFDDQACDGDRICLGGVCRAPECQQDTDCQDSERCENHRCQNSIQCTKDTDCNETEYCDAGTCKLRQVPRCPTDSVCLDNELCLDGTCQNKPGCTADRECPDQTVCQGGLCERPCIDDESCAPLRKCVPDGHCRQQCLTDETCLEPETICEDNLCVPAQCSDETACQGENLRCQDGRCQTFTPCTTDPDCNDANFICVQGACRERPTCVIERDCEDGQICQDGHCRETTTCAKEEECLADQDCVANVCVPHVCRGPADCEDGWLCVGGECTEAGEIATVAAVVILTPGGPIRAGQTIQLVAIALTPAGEEVPGAPMEWTSSRPESAAVSASGLLTGGAEEGTAAVTARARGTQIVSAPITFANFAGVPADTVRVTVVEAFGRAPVVGATVMLVTNDGSAVVISDDRGVATFTTTAAVVSVHAFSSDHDYVSIFQTTSTDLLIPLHERSNAAVAGGFVGQMTFSGVGSVSLGLGGASLGGDLVDLNFAQLLGQIFMVQVDLGFRTVVLPLPAQMVVAAEFGPMPVRVKDTYYVLGQKGLRTAWGMGGKLDLAVLTNLFQGGGTIEEILTGLLPYFAAFDHGLKPTFNVVPLPLVADADDIDGDRNTAELRPNWNNFQDLDLAPSHSQTMLVRVSAPSLPLHKESPIQTAVLLAGGVTPLGFTPLGLTSSQAPDGLLPPVDMKLAPVYGGLEVGPYRILVLGFPSGSGTEMPTNLAIVAYEDVNLPKDVTFESDFLAFPEDANFSSATRTLVASGIKGASLFRSTIQGPRRNWVVHLPPADVVTFTLPVPPDGIDDLVDRTNIVLVPIALRSGLTFEDLVSLGGLGLDQIDRAAAAYSTFQL